MMSLNGKTQGCLEYEVAKVKGFSLRRKLNVEGRAHRTKGREVGGCGCKCSGISLLSVGGRGDTEYL